LSGLALVGIEVEGKGGYIPSVLEIVGIASGDVGINGCVSGMVCWERGDGEWGKISEDWGVFVG